MAPIGPTSPSPSKEIALFSDSLGTAHRRTAWGDGHRCGSPLPTGWGLVLCFVLSTLAIVFRTPLALGAVTLLDGALLLLYRVEERGLRRLLRLFLWQTALISALYLLRFGGAEGLGPALRTSWQLLLVFLPGLVVVGGASQTELVRTLGRVLSHRTAFVLSVSLKFVPLLLGEARAIYEAQALRGARILPRDLLNPHKLARPSALPGSAHGGPGHGNSRGNRPGRQGPGVRPLHPPHRLAG